MRPQNGRRTPLSSCAALSSAKRYARACCGVSLAATCTGTFSSPSFFAASSRTCPAKTTPSVSTTIGWRQSNSLIDAATLSIAAGAGTIKFVCVVAAPEGVTTFKEAHPDVPVFTAAVDQRLDDHGYIVPGIGDAGDRLYSTKQRSAPKGI